MGAITGIQAYDHSEIPLFLSGTSACTKRGPKSLAGFNPGPVGPPKDATRAPTRIPTPSCPIPGVLCKAVELSINSAPKTKRKVPKNSATNPFV